MHIWNDLNPDKIYVENIRQFFNLSTRVAKFFCEAAVSHGAFIKRYEVICPNEGRSLLEFNKRQDIPEIIECKNCELLEKQFKFNRLDCKINEFYLLAKI
jgi:hypothetical protein